ncbi:MAG: transglutaminase-like domain-containing protein [Candidatus Hydrogenedentota bacterium]
MPVGTTHRIRPVLIAIAALLAMQHAQPASLEDAFVPPAPADEAPETYTNLGRDEDAEVLDEALAAIFAGGARPEAVETRVLHVLAYVAQVTRMEPLGAEHGSACLAAGKGYCTDMAQAFVALCRRMGLPARVNSFHNIEWMQGHSAAEVHYDGGWHFFDPTFAVFFYSRDAYDGRGRVRPLRELIGGAETPEHCFAVVPEVWTGENTHPPRPEPAAGKNAGRHTYTLGEFYRQIFRTTFPPVFTPRQTVSMPFVMRLANGEAWAGKRDGHTDDLFARREDRTYPRYHGFTQVGQTRNVHVLNTLVLEDGRPGWYRLTYHFTGMSQYDTMRAVPLMSVLPRTPEIEEDRWSLVFYLQDNSGILLIDNPSGRAYIDAVHVAAIDVPRPEPGPEPDTARAETAPEKDTAP